METKRSITTAQHAANCARLCLSWLDPTRAAGNHISVANLKHLAGDRVADRWERVVGDGSIDVGIVREARELEIAVAIELIWIGGRADFREVPGQRAELVECADGDLVVEDGAEVARSDVGGFGGAELHVWVSLGDEDEDVRRGVGVRVRWESAIGTAVLMVAAVVVGIVVAGDDRVGGCEGSESSHEERGGGLHGD